ncbi:hypothetical protein J3E72DRAFT_324141 [Bipolaris maydis]|nr:hypothetical protein BM1_01202 [Bipolaris maydis]KAJ6197549.1 hypothetical protein J3E72DRAFT_324141 [Bipolaris maydis]
MRFSTISLAFLAGAVAAAPQGDVLPISQISDGQIQAPPATPPAVSAPSALPSAVPSVVPSAVSSASGVTEVPPLSQVSVGKSALVLYNCSTKYSLLTTLQGTGAVPLPSATATATPVAPGTPGTTPIVIPPGGSNSTVPAPSGSAAQSSGPSASASESSPAGSTAGASSSPTSSSTSVPQAGGAAAGNMVSFGGLVLAIGAAVFA